MIFGKGDHTVHFIPMYPTLASLTETLASLVESDTQAAQNDVPAAVRLAIQGAIVNTARAIATMGEPQAYEAPK